MQITQSFIEPQYKVLGNVNKLKKLGEKLRFCLLADVLVIDRIKQAANMRLIELEKIQFMEEVNG